GEEERKPGTGPFPRRVRKHGAIVASSRQSEGGQEVAHLKGRPAEFLPASSLSCCWRRSSHVLTRGFWSLSRTLRPTPVVSLLPRHDRVHGHRLCPRAGGPPRHHTPSRADRGRSARRATAGPARCVEPGSRQFSAPADAGRSSRGVKEFADLALTV